MSDSQISHSVPAPSVNGRGEGSDANGDGVRPPVFPEGEFYSCTDPETLSHDTPGAALEEWADDRASKDCDMAALIREHAPVTVTAYNPMAAPDHAWIVRQADSLTETLWEHWSEERGNPDADEPLQGFPDEAEAIMREAVGKIVAASRVWSCEPVGSVTLTAEQAEAILRADRPDWFSAPISSPTASEPRVVHFGPATSRCAKSVSVPGPDSGRTP